MKDRNIEHFGAKRALFFANDAAARRRRRYQMKKKIMSFLLGLCLAITLCIPALAAGGPGVSIDGTAVVFSDDTGYPFVDANGRTLVPLRVTMETYGCEVFWDNENKSAIVYRDGGTVVCPIGKNSILVNGETVAIDTAAVIVDNRTYLPIRCVLEAVGAAVDWDGAARNVLVTRGDTGVLLEQDDYITGAMEAVDANSSLSGKYTADVKKAVTLYLQNVPVDEAQITKMCARLQLVTVREGKLGAELAGYCSTNDNIHYTITLDTVTEGKIRDSAYYDRVMFHELCHMFSNIPQTSKWFQEGMTTMFEVDIAGSELIHIDLYDVYYRVICILTELLGKDVMREAYLTGSESRIYTLLNGYAGVTDSSALLNSNVEKMTSAMIGGIFTWMEKSGGKTKEQWQQEYDASVQTLSALFEKAYAGKFGSSIYENPLLSVYLAWLRSFTFIGTTRIMSDPTIAYDTAINYYGLKDYRSFVLILDKSSAFCQDGELVYYREGN
jgi:hypothetical protein